MEDKAVEFVDQVGQGQFGLRPSEADCADEKPIAVLLVYEDMFNLVRTRLTPQRSPRCVLGHGLALGLPAMNATFEHVARQPGFVLLTATGAIGPEIARSCWCRLPAGAGAHRCLQPISPPDEPKAPIDADMRLVAEYRGRDLRQRRPVGTITDLAPDLDRPARIDILLARLVGLATPGLLCRLPALMAAFCSCVLRCLDAGTMLA